MNFLPGWLAYIPTTTVVVPITSLSQVASATSTAVTITGPSGIVAKDLLVLLDRANNISGTPSTVLPTGFTAISNITDSFTRQILSYKLADGSEASASLTGMNGTEYETKALYVFRGNTPINSVASASPNGQMIDGNPTLQTVTSSSGVVPLVVIGAYATYSADVSPRSFTPAKDGEIPVNFDGLDETWLAYKIYNSSPANVSIDMDDEGYSNGLQSCYITAS